MFSRTALLLLGLWGCLGWVPSGLGASTPEAAKQPAVSPSRESAKEVIRTRRFADKRDLETYLNELPPEFGRDLLALGPYHRILDAGAGALYFAEQLVSLRTPKSDASAELKRFLSQPTEKRPFTTAITLNLEREVPAHGGKLKVIWGRFFAEIPEEELGTFDLIVDLKGIFAYAPAADDVLRKYLRLLKPEGRLYLYLGSVGEGYAFRSFVKSGNHRLSLAEWARGLEGLKTQQLSRDTARGDPALTLRIQKMPEVNSQIPRLSLMGIDTSQPGPPTRIYWQRETIKATKRSE